MGKSTDMPESWKNIKWEDWDNSNYESKEHTNLEEPIKTYDYSKTNDGLKAFGIGSLFSIIPFAVYASSPEETIAYVGAGILSGLSIYHFKEAKKNFENSNIQDIKDKNLRVKLQEKITLDIGQLVKNTCNNIRK